MQVCSKIDFILQKECIQIVSAVRKRQSFQQYSIIFFYVQTMLNSLFPWYSRRKQTITLKTGKLMNLDAMGALSYEEEDDDGHSE